MCGQASRLCKRPDTGSIISGFMEFDEENFRDVSDSQREMEQVYLFA